MEKRCENDDDEAPFVTALKKHFQQTNAFLVRGLGLAMGLEPERVEEIISEEEHKSKEGE